MCDIISFTDENKMFHGGFSVDSFLERQEHEEHAKNLVGGGKKPSSSTLHTQEFAVPGTMFFIPAAFGGGNKKYDEQEKEDKIVDDELYDKLLGSVELKSGKLGKHSRKQSNKNKEIGKKTRKQKL
jgi:hypothetical protein